MVRSKGIGFFHYAAHTAFIATVALAVSAGDASAQNDGTQASGPKTALDEVMVVARKRVEPLQETPVAVSTLGGQNYQLRFPTDLKDLEFPAPNVNIARLSSFTNAITVFIRGIGNSDNDSTVDPPVAIFVDGIYTPRPENSSLDMFDIEQVEIMRGPQGTLFGRNTTAGAIHLRTRRPSGEFGTRGRITAGKFGRLDIRAAVDVPLIEDKVDAKIAFMNSTMDGYHTNTADGSDLGDEDVINVRPMIRFRPNDDLELTIIGEYSRARSGATPQQNASSPGQLLCLLHGFCGAGALGTIDEFAVAPNVIGSIDNDVYGITTELNWDVGPGTLTWVSNYRKTDSVIVIDIDQTMAPMFEVLRNSPHEQGSSELRYASTIGDKFDFVTGLYFFTQDHFLRRDTFLNIVPGTPIVHIVGNTKQKHKNLSAFAEGNYHVNDKLTVTLGGRFTWERKSFWQEPFGPFPNAQARITPDPKKWSNFGPKAGVDYRWNDDIMTYASYSRGFKSGGFNGRGGSPTTLGPFGPEKVDAFEIGMKSDWMDNRVRLNVALFWNEYDDLQRTVIRFLPGAANPQETVTQNAASARVRGIEVELTALPTEGLQFDFSLSYLDASYNDFCADLNGAEVLLAAPTSPCGGNVTNVFNPGGAGAGTYLVDDDFSGLSLQRAPKWQLAINGTYEFQVGNGGNVIVNARYSYTGSLATDVTNNPKAFRKATNLVDASLTYEEPEGRYSISVFGKNLTNELYLNGATLVAALFDTRSVNTPRRWGVQIGWDL